MLTKRFLSFHKKVFLKKIVAQLAQSQNVKSEIRLVKEI